MIPTPTGLASGCPDRHDSRGTTSSLSSLRQHRPSARATEARLRAAPVSGYRSALLVGGSSAIGQAIVTALLTAPGRLVLAGRPSPELDEALCRARGHGHRADSVPYDALWSTVPCEALVDSVWREHQGFDLVVVSVGCLQAGVRPEHIQGAGGGRARSGGRSQVHAVPEPLPGAPVSEPDLETLLQTNLVGPALVANRVADHLASQGHGALVVVTSAAAIRPRQEVLAYAAAKQALDTLARGLDRRLRPYGARCLVVRPGRVSTRMAAGLPPVPLTTGPEHVAARVRGALSRSTSVVWSPRGMGLLTHAVRLAPPALLPARLR